MKAEGVIYLVTNKINDKVYVGKTNDFTIRKIYLKQLKAQKLHM